MSSIIAFFVIFGCTVVLAKAQPHSPTPSITLTGGNNLEAYVNATCEGVRHRINNCESLLDEFANELHDRNFNMVGFRWRLQQAIQLFEQDISQMSSHWKSILLTEEANIRAQEHAHSHLSEQVAATKEKYQKMIEEATRQFHHRIGIAKNRFKQLEQILLNNIASHLYNDCESM